MTGRTQLVVSPDEHCPAPRHRSRVLALMVALSFLAVSGQLVRLAIEASTGSGLRVAMIHAEEPTNVARPDLVDRKGRLLATDVQVPSLAADPLLIQDPDDTAEKLVSLFPDLDRRGLRDALADSSRRFVWVKRALSPLLAQKANDLGLPGLFFRDELKRTYPAGRLGGHALGLVDVDNRGLSGIERWLDGAYGIEAVHGARLSGKAPVRLSLDIGVMHAVEDELEAAITRYDARAAAGLVLDATTGEVVAHVSLPGVDPMVAGEARERERLDRLSSGTYELGSVMKLVTVALALEAGKSPDSLVDTTRPLTAGRFEIADLHPLGRPMTLAEVFIHSSNVGAGSLALEVGAEPQRAFLDRLGLLAALDTELGRGPRPQAPGAFGRAEQITIAFGHGLAVTPLQFAAAAAGLLNGGKPIRPTFVARDGDAAAPARPVTHTGALVSPKTSALLRQLMRANVTDPEGTGRRADVPGYRVGGKTGTAEIAQGGRYRAKSVISSFLGVFPSEAPRYVTLVLLFEPRGTDPSGGEITAGRNAAPTTARIIERIAPLLGVMAGEG